MRSQRQCWLYDIKIMLKCVPKFQYRYRQRSVEALPDESVDRVTACVLGDEFQSTLAATLEALQKRSKK